ncbi:MAG: glycosyltransferase [Bacteroidota bacterium]
MPNDISSSIQQQQGPLPLDARFSILIPSWNNLPYLKLCVESIRRHSHFPHQIIVHINQGTDGSLDWVRQEQMAHTYSAANVGVCHALNAARELVQTNFLLFLNDDMFCCPDWDLPLWQAIQRQPDERYFLSSTMIEPYASGNPAVLAPYDFGRQPDDFREADLLRALPNMPKADWSGASWPPNLVPLSLWDQVGGYSVEYSPGFYSDPDFSRKLWEIGVRRFIGLGESRVYHFGRKSTVRIPKGKGKRLFVRKWGVTPADFYRYYLRMGASWQGSLEEPKPTWAFRWAKWKGWLKGFR